MGKSFGTKSKYVLSMMIECGGEATVVVCSAWVDILMRLELQEIKVEFANRQKKLCNQLTLTMTKWVWKRRSCGDGWTKTKNLDEQNQNQNYSDSQSGFISVGEKSRSKTNRDTWRKAVHQAKSGSCLLHCLQPVHWKGIKLWISKFEIIIK